MTEVQPDTYTRKDLMIKFNYGYRSVRRIWKEILKPLTPEQRKKFKTRLPIKLYEDYMNK